jgi:hypothetical protein
MRYGNDYISYPSALLFFCSRPSRSLHAARQEPGMGNGKRTDGFKDHNSEAWESLSPNMMSNSSCDFLLNTSEISAQEGSE